MMSQEILYQEEEEICPKCNHRMEDHEEILSEDEVTYKCLLCKCVDVL